MLTLTLDILDVEVFHVHILHAKEPANVFLSACTMINDFNYFRHDVHYDRLLTSSTFDIFTSCFCSPKETENEWSLIKQYSILNVVSKVSLVFR